MVGIDRYDCIHQFCAVRAAKSQWHHNARTLLLSIRIGVMHQQPTNTLLIPCTGPREMADTFDSSDDFKSVHNQKRAVYVRGIPILKP